MARSRNIKPSFFKNYELADEGPLVQLLFEGLWCLADREGRLEDKPRLIKAEIFPYYDVDVNDKLTVLERLGFILRYSHNNIKVIQVVNFKKHQSPHHTEKDSELPSIENNYNDKTIIKTNASECENKLTVNSRLNNESSTVNIPLIPDSLIPDSLIPEKRKKHPPPYNEIVNLYHKTLPTLPEIAKLTDQRKTKIKKLWLEDLKELKMWENYFKYVSESNFLMGKVNGSNGNSFKCSIDFLINYQNFIKISEEKYHG